MGEPRAVTSPAPAGSGTVPRILATSPTADACETVYLPPLPGPLSWRVAYSGVGDTYHHCPSWSRFGPVRPNGKWHKGLDIAAPTGTPVLATVAGTLSYARDPKGWGLYARIDYRPKTRTPNGTCREGEPMRFVYAHLIDNDPALPMGQDRPVNAGEVIGHVGCSGNAGAMCSPSPESHVHVTLRQAKGSRTKVDPLPVVAWPLLTPPPTAFQPALKPCPM